MDQQIMSLKESNSISSTYVYHNSNRQQSIMTNVHKISNFRSHSLRLTILTSPAMDAALFNRSNAKFQSETNDN